MNEVTGEAGLSIKPGAQAPGQNTIPLQCERLDSVLRENYSRFIKPDDNSTFRLSLN